MTQKPKPDISQISSWLNTKYNGRVTGLAPISGGFWSSAYTFSVDQDNLVLRFSDLAEGFAIDQAAMQFTSPALPIPAVLEIGDALGHAYAVSRRHYGRFLENISESEADTAGKALAQLLVALRAAPPPTNPVVSWSNPNATADFTWHDFLRQGLLDQPDSFLHGWREKLKANKPQLENLFVALESRIEELLPYCPERRDLIHGDLLHQNVLISENASEVTAIFSWKCSVLGDFLYDVAWCTIWEPWHPGIAAADMWQRTLDATDLSPDNMENAALRHHCYELQIAASHFGWNIWIGNDADLEATAARGKAILDRGPRSMS